MARSCLPGRPPAARPGHGRAPPAAPCCQEADRGIGPIRTHALPAASPAPNGKAPPRSRRPAVANTGPPARGQAFPLEPANLPKPCLPQGKTLSRARPCVTTPRLGPSAGEALPQNRPPTAMPCCRGSVEHCHVAGRQRQRLATGPAAHSKALTPWPPTCTAVPAACGEASPRRGEPCVAKHCRWAGRPRQGLVTETAAHTCNDVCTLASLAAGPAACGRALPRALA